MSSALSGPSGRGGCGGGGQIRSFARKGDIFLLISTAAAVDGDKGDEERRIRRQGRRSSGDAREGAAAAWAAVPAARATEQRWTGRAEMRERGGGRAFFFR
jgi:hypothetical protein